MPDMFTPLISGQPGRAETFNAVFQEFETAILARDGSLVQVIPETTLTATQANITMDLAITVYPVLILHLYLRTTRNPGSGLDNVRLTINDDALSTYVCNYIGVEGGTLTGYNTSAVTGCELGYAASDSNSGNTGNGFAEVKISQANALTPKSGTFHASATGTGMAFGGFFYPASVLITRIKLVPVLGTLFAVGSKYALYGTN